MTSVMQKWAGQSGDVTISDKAREFVTEINLKRGLAAAAGATALDAELSFLNLARECGILLENGKAALGRVQWELVQGELAFNDRQVQGLLDFARKFPEPITDAREAVRSLNDAQMALGLADFPEGHGPQEIREPNFALEITKLITATRAKIHRQVERDPVSKWSPSYARQFVAGFEPLMADIWKVYAEAKERASA